jgi:2-dehydro-3-deoxyphosphooctonate aldolase (KDO 8-P synthase)
VSVSFKIDSVRIGSGNPFLSAGPFAIESEEHALFVAEVIKGDTGVLNFPFIFEALFDKTNRASIRSYLRAGPCGRLAHTEKNRE